MYSDTTADMLTRIRNGYMAKKAKVVMPFSKFKHEIAKLLIANDYLQDVKLLKDGNKKDLEVTLLYKDEKPAITHVERVSRSGLRIYQKKTELPYVLSGKGIAVISTSSGVMTDKEARKKSLGGEIVCKIW